MKETRTINLTGVVFNIDNDAFQALNDYLHDIELRLTREERDSTMVRIETRVCDFFQSELFARHIQVVDIQMVNSVMEHIGAPSEFGTNKRPRIKRGVGSERSGCARVLGITLLVLLFFSVLPIILPLLFTLFVALFGVFGIGVPMLFDAGGWQIGLAIMAFVAAIVIPIGVIVYLIATYVRTHTTPKARFWIIAVICWLISLGCLGVLSFKAVEQFGGLQELKEYFEDPDLAMTGAGLTTELPFFNAINIDGAMNVDIIQGEQPSIAINDSMLVVYELKDSVLAISGTQINAPRHATVTVTDLSALNISGASSVDVQGHFNEMHYTLSGASKLDAEQAQVAVVHINCLGASKASVYASDELWAQASGASKITYKGHPAIKRNLTVGASKISHD